MRALLGDRARYMGNSLALDLDAQGKAIIELPAQGISLRDHPFLALRVGADSEASRLMLIWRQGPRAQVQRRELPAMPGETLLVNLSQLEQWQGTASLIAIAATGDAGQTLALEMAALKRSSLSNILASTWQDWTYYNGLNQSATNAHTGVARGSLAWSAAPYVALVLLPLLLGLVFVQWRGPGPKAWQYLLTGIFLGWLALDTLWLSLWFRQTQETHAQYAHLPAEERLRQGEWGQIYRFVESIKALDEISDQRRYFIASQDEFLRLLTHFHMLPRASYWDRGRPELPRDKHLHPGDYLVLIFPSQWRFDEQQSVLSLQGRAPIPVVALLKDNRGAVYEVQ